MKARGVFYQGILSALLAGSTAACNAEMPTAGEIEARAPELAKALVGQVKPMLQGAMAEGGPRHAVEVCAVRAPEIADALSEESGWRVGRVSLQARNSSRGQPDAWEAAGLARLEAMQAAGTEPANLHIGEWVDGRYRYLRAQVVDGVCLACHGTDIDPALAETIREYYPDDSATGYQLGDIRGAITLSSPRR
jgi:hypothetical protein